MGYFLGFDTSNYTTSAACYRPEGSTICHSKLLLPVKQGELGLRQSDALFHHIRQLPEALSRARRGADEPLMGVCASERPRSLPDSYMPCFLAGKTTGEAVAQVMGVPYFGVSHQEGHLAAALYSVGRLDLLEKPFIAFHVSGGTTEALYVTPDAGRVLSVEILAHTLDISAGQLIDRVGVGLDMPFPAGPHLDKLAQTSDQDDFRPIPLKNGCFNLSGMENIIRERLKEGCPPKDAARFLFMTLAELFLAITSYAWEKAGRLPVLFCGGVLCNSIISESILRTQKDQPLLIAKPEYASDNAAGVAILGFLLHQIQGRGAV